MNNINFEDRERTLEEIKYLSFNTLYLWTTIVIFSCIFPMYLEAFYAFNDNLSTYRKENHFPAKF
jgi:hypothetical protein